MAVKSFEEWAAGTGAYQHEKGLFHDSLRNDGGSISPGIWAGEDRESPEQQLRNFYNAVYIPGADGRLPYGTEGRDFDPSKANLGFFNPLPSVTIDGKQYARVTEDPNTWRGHERGDKTRDLLKQLPNQPLARYDEKYGWVMPEDLYTAFGNATIADDKGNWTDYFPMVFIAAVSAGVGAIGAAGAAAAGGTAATGAATAGAGAWSAASLAAKIPSLLVSLASGQNPVIAFASAGLSMGMDGLAEAANGAWDSLTGTTAATAGEFSLHTAGAGIGGVGSSGLGLVPAAGGAEMLGAGLGGYDAAAAAAGAVGGLTAPLGGAGMLGEGANLPQPGIISEVATPAAPLTPDAPQVPEIDPFEVDGAQGAGPPPPGPLQQAYDALKKVPLGNMLAGAGMLSAAGAASAQGQQLMPGTPAETPVMDQNLAPVGVGVRRNSSSLRDMQGRPIYGPGGGIISNTRRAA